MLPQSLENNPQAIAGWNAASRELIAQITSGKLVLRATVGAFYSHTGHWLIPLEGNLARHGNQVKGSGRCLCGNGGRKPGKYSDCNKTHEFTVHGPAQLKKECG